jgi:magnesium chelatase subunit D
MEEKTGNTIIFVVDASGSMGVKKRMSAVKGAVLSLLIDAYQKRDKVGIVTFRGDCADLLLSPTSSIDLAETKLKVIPTGGRTPLGKGLQMGFDVLSQELHRDPKTKPLLILISDGKANVSSAAEKPLDELKKIADCIQKAKIPSLMLDSEAGLVRLGYAEKLANMMGAKYMKLDEIAYGGLI